LKNIKQFRYQYFTIKESQEENPCGYKGSTVNILYDSKVVYFSIPHQNRPSFSSMASASLRFYFSI